MAIDSVAVDSGALWHFMIGGPPRSGKSTLAALLQDETGGMIVRADALMTAFTSTAAETGLSSDSIEALDSTFLALVVCRYARSLSRREGIPIIVEGIGLTPESIDRGLLRQARFRPVFLGYPYISVEEKTDQIKRHAETDPTCWSHDVSDLRLREITGAAIRDSLETRLKCFRAGLPFFDTGKDFDATLAAARDRLLRQANSNRPDDGSD